MCEYLQYFKEHDISYDVYSFAKIMSEYFDMSDVQEEHMFFMLNKIWTDRKDLAGNIRYENLVIATCIFIKDKTQDQWYDTKDIVSDLYPDNHKVYVTQIYTVYNRLQHIFTQF